MGKVVRKKIMILCWEVLLEGRRNPALSAADLELLWVVVIVWCTGVLAQREAICTALCSGWCWKHCVGNSLNFWKTLENITDFAWVLTDLGCWEGGVLILWTACVGAERKAEGFSCPSQTSSTLQTKVFLCGWLVGFCLCVWFGVLVVSSCWVFSNPVDNLPKISGM